MDRPSRSHHEQFRTQGFAHRAYNTAVQKCASRSTEFASRDAAHKGFCWTFPLYRPARFLEQFRTQGFLRIESIAVQRCARKSTEFAWDKKNADENRGDMENSLVTQDYTHRGFC